MNDVPRGFYCFSQGVLFWEKTVAADSSSSTLTVGARDFAELAAVLAGVLESFASVIRWHTTLYEQWSGRVQQVRVRKQIAEDPGGFFETVVLDVGGIFTNASRFMPPLTATHLEFLSARDSTLLLISERSLLSPKDVCALMSAWASAVSESAVTALGRANQDLLVARVVSHEDTVSVMQFFGDQGILARIGTMLSEREVDALRDRDEVAAWMESTAGG